MMKMVLAVSERSARFSWRYSDKRHCSPALPNGRQNEDTQDDSRSGSMARILIVDDSPTQTLSLSKILKKHGHEVITAKDGAEGVEVAKAELPDLVLMDVVMPKINGFQATRQDHQNPSTSHIPVIIVTTKDQETDKIWGERQGAKGYVIKPVDEDVLVETINKFLP
jgi:twitching motility two-component system response regulator PilH